MTEILSYHAIYLHYFENY